MTTYNYDFHEGITVPIKSWTRGVPIENAAMQQLRNLSALPFIYNGTV
mgnify:CR=1 FL=1